MGASPGHHGGGGVPVVDRNEDPRQAQVRPLPVQVAPPPPSQIYEVIAVALVYHVGNYGRVDVQQGRDVRIRRGGPEHPEAGEVEVDAGIVQPRGPRIEKL